MAILGGKNGNASREGPGILTRMNALIDGAVLGAPEATTRNGAQTLLDTLVACGVDTVFGYPGGAVLPLYDALHGEPRLRHILVRHEQAAVHAARGLRAQHGTPGRGAGDLGAGDEQHDDGVAGRTVRLDPGALHQRAGEQRRDRHGCVPGVRCVGHLAPGDEVERASCGPADDVAARCARRVDIARGGRPGPVLLDVPKDVQLAPARRTSSLPIRTLSGDAGRGRARGRAGGGLDRDSAAPGVLRRRRADQRRGRGLRGVPAASVALQRRALHADLDGARALPASDRRSGCGMLGMHGTLEANLGDASRRPDRVRGRAFRRSRDGAPGQLRPQRPGDPPGRRSGVDRQGPPRDLAPCAAMHACCCRGRGARWSNARCRRNGSWTGGGASTPGGRSARWPSRTAPDVIAPAGIDDAAAGTTRRSRRDRVDRCRPASDVGGAAPCVRAAAAMADFGRRRHDGLRPARGDRRAGGASGAAGRVRQRGCVDPDEPPGDGHGAPASRGGQGRAGQQRAHGHGAAVAGAHHGERYSHSYNACMLDFVAVAKGFGVEALRVDRRENLDAALAERLASDGPYFLDVAVAPAENCFPMIPAGKGHQEVMLGSRASAPDRCQAVSGAKRKLTLRSFNQATSSSPSCCIRPTTMPAWTPARFANAVTAAREGETLGSLPCQG